MMATEQTTTRTVAEIEAELQAAKEAESKRKQEQERELALARRREELLLTDGYMERLHAAITTLGVECSVQPGRTGEYDNVYYATLSYPEGSDGFRASAQPRLERRSGGYLTPDSYQIQFGGYGERKTYPRLKDGTFKYDKIASELVAFIKQKTAQRQRQEEREQAYKVSRKLEDELEREFPDCSVYIRATEQPDAVVIKFERALSTEQAREILTAIQKVVTDTATHTN